MATIKINHTRDNPHQTTSGIRDDTSSRGVDLAGAQITAAYADGTVETLTWQALDPYTFGGASSAGLDMHFGFDLHVLTAVKPLSLLKIDLAPASSVFDTATAMDQDLESGSTPTSKNGFAFKVAPEFDALSGMITATYSGIVSLAGSPAVGDLFTTMTVDFTGLFGGGLLGELVWNSDIDTMRVPGDLVPLSGIMLAGPDDDLLFGTSGDDVLQGFGGADVLDGGDGFDTALYQQPQNVFTLRLGATVEIEDRTGVEGTDTLARIETLDFGGETFDLLRYDSVAKLSAAEFSTFTEMYIAYFNRAPDAVGLMFWANAYATGTSLEEIAGFFSTSAEAQALYPSDVSGGAFVETIYLNVLGRASDPSGAAFWSGVLDNGSVSQSEFVLAVLRGARADPPVGASADFLSQQQADVAFLDNKVDIGVYFSAILGMSDLGNATSVMALYDGSVSSVAVAKMAADVDFEVAQGTDSDGSFLIQLVGVVDDPFA